MDILIVGRGKMARVMTDVCRFQSHTAASIDFARTAIISGVAVHFGSGRELPELLDICERDGLPLIQGSTNVDVPTGRNVVIINAPNLSVPMIRFMAAAPAFLEAVIPGMELRIVESHQKGKKDTSGTARSIAGKLGVPEAAIASIRDPGAQRLLGVPPEHLDGHGYHYITLAGQGVEIQVTTKVNGRATYAEGALAVAQALVSLPEPLRPGLYNLPDILPLLFPAA